MDYTVSAALAAGKAGYYIGNRLILPFKCQVLKLILKSKIYCDFVHGEKIIVIQEPRNTSIYFFEDDILSEIMDTYRNLKLIVSEFDADLCDLPSHFKLICNIEEGHKVIIQEPGEDILFIE